MTLHILNKSPHATQCLQECLQIAQPTDALLLIEDAVYAAVAPYARQLQESRLIVYALAADIEARGLASMDTGTIQIINDHQFVDLTIEYSPIQSWY